MASMKLSRESSMLCLPQGRCTGAIWCSLSRLKALGVSAMMHGYLAFDEHDTLLVPFRTWRNTMTEAAAQSSATSLTTRCPSAGPSVTSTRRSSTKRSMYTASVPHYPRRLCPLPPHREKILGIGDGSGMFPSTPRPDSMMKACSPPSKPLWPHTPSDGI